MVFGGDLPWYNFKNHPKINPSNKNIIAWYPRPQWDRHNLSGGFSGDESHGTTHGRQSPTLRLKKKSGARKGMAVLLRQRNTAGWISYVILMGFPRQKVRTFPAMFFQPC